MACSKPVVASSIDGYASVLTHNEEGLLVPPKDADSLAQALLSLLGDSSLRNRMGEKGVLHAQKFSWENVSTQIMDYYLELLH